MKFEKGKLQRRISLLPLVLYGIGTILGAGIYVLIGKVMVYAKMSTPFSFIIASVAALFTAFSYAELSSRYPKSGGEAIYVLKAFNNKILSLLVGLLLVCMGIVASATMIKGLSALFQFYAQIPEYIIITIFIFLLGLVIFWGIFESVFLASLMTFLEIFGVLIVLYLTHDKLLESIPRVNEIIPHTTSEWKGAFYGAYLAFFAFIGFEDMVNIAEEVKNPRRNLPLSIFIAVIFCSLIYFLIVFVATFAFPNDLLIGSDAPLAEIVKVYAPEILPTFTIIAAAALINGALVQIIMGTRILYGLSQEKSLPAIFGKVWSRTSTPVWSTIFVSILVLMGALVFPLEQLAAATSMLVLTVFILMNISLITLKMKNIDNKGAITVPLLVPFFALFCCAFLLFTPLF